MHKSIRTLAATAALVALTIGPALAQESKPAPAPAPTKTQQTTAAKTEKTTEHATHHAAWTKEQIKQAQEGLAKGGYYKGKNSGIMNKETQSALRAFQKANKMPVTGRLSDQVLQKLSA